jgi:hypothetical protein
MFALARKVDRRRTPQWRGQQREESDLAGVKPAERRSPRL